MISYMDVYYVNKPLVKVNLGHFMQVYDIYSKVHLQFLFSSPTPSPSLPLSPPLPLYLFYLFLPLIHYEQLIASFASQEQKEYASAGAVAEEVLSSIRTVISFGGESREAER